MSTSLVVLFVGLGILVLGFGAALFNMSRGYGKHGIAQDNFGSIFKGHLALMFVIFLGWVTTLMF